MQVYGVASQDRIFITGRSGQFTGHRRKAVFTIGIYKKALDAPIKRVGFMGTDNDQPMRIEVQPSAEYNTGLWDLEFNLHETVETSMGDWFHRIKGSFFAETTNNTYYWLKDKGEDFEFDGYSRFVLTDYGSVFRL
jgi:hypothetical protein